MLKLLSPANSCVTFILISLILSTTISSSAPLPNDLPDVIDESAGNVASLEKKYDGSSSEVVSEATSLAPNSPVEFVTEQPASNNIASNSEENKQQQTTDNNNQEPSAIETLTSPRVEESGPISDKTTPITEVPSSSSSSSTETKLPPTTLDSDPISSQSQSESAVPTTTNKQDGPTTLSVTQELPTSKKANDESSSDAMYGSSSTEAKIESMSPTTIIPKIEVSKEDTTSSTTTTAPSVDDNNSEKPKEQTLKPVDVMVPEVPSNVESKTKPGEVSSDIQPVVKDLSETKQVATKTDSINDDKKSIVITDLLANKDDTENDLNSPDLDGPVDFSSNPKDSGLNNHGHDGRFHYAFDGAPLDTNQNKIETTTARSSPSEVSEKSETEKQTSTTAPPPPPSSPPPATSLAPVQTDMDSKKQQESTSVTAITTNDETTTKSSTDNAKPLLGSELPGNTVRSDPLSEINRDSPSDVLRDRHIDHLFMTGETIYDDLMIFQRNLQMLTSQLEKAIKTRSLDSLVVGIRNSDIELLKNDETVRPKCKIIGRILDMYKNQKPAQSSNTATHKRKLAFNDKPNTTIKKTKM